MGFNILCRVMGGLTSHHHHHHKRGNSDYSHSSPPHNYDNHINTHVSKKQKTQPFMDTCITNSVNSSSSYTVKSPSLWNKLLGYFKKEGLREKMVPYYRDHNKGIPVVILNSCRYNGVCENEEEGSFDEKRAELLLNYASKGKKAVGSIRNKFLIKDERVVVGSVDKVIDLDKDNDSDEDEVRIVESGGVNLELEKEDKVCFVNDLDIDDDGSEIIENRSVVSELEDKEKVDLVNRVIDLDEDDCSDDDETAFIENGGKILPLVKEEKDDLVNEVIDLDNDDIDDDEVQIVEHGGMDMELDNMGKTLTTLSLDSDEDSVSELPVHTLEPFVPLTNEEKDEVFRAFSSHNWRNVLVTHENANIDITGKILHCLKAEEWLNDEVVNVYFHLLKERETREPNKFLKCHFFNTFFYKKLISGKSGYDYKSVRRWTTKKKLGYNLSECDKIFVPIHKQAHWCLAVINKKDRKFQYLDSLGGIDTKLLKVLAMYYADELKDKNGVDIDVFSWTHERVDNIPLQKNGSDCGMFMIKYVDFYSRGLGLCFNQKHMPYFRWRTAKEILRLEAR